MSWIKNAIPVIAALYVISPVDLAPDFLPGIGQIDDVGLLVALMLVMIRLLPKLAPADVVAEHLDDIRGTVRPQGREAGTAGEQVVEGRFRVRD